MHNNIAFDKELYARALDTIQAPEGLWEAVMAQAEKIPAPGRARRGLRLALVAAALAALLLGTAYATGLGARLLELLPASGAQTQSFASAAFGDEIAVSQRFYTSADGTLHAGAQTERVPVDKAAAADILGDYMTRADTVVTVENYTFTMEEFFMDENGMGVLAYTIACPEGVKGWYEAGNGEIVFNWTDASGDGFVQPILYTGDGRGFSGRTLWRAEASSETALSILCYFGGGHYTTGEPVYMDLKFADRSEGRNYGEYLACQTVAFQPESYVPVRRLTCAEVGLSVAVSPIGIRVELPGQNSDSLLDECILHFADGSDYIVRSNDSNWDNTVFGYYSGGTGEEAVPCQVNELFNRLIDPAELLLVTVAGRGPWEEPDATFAYEYK